LLEVGALNVTYNYSASRNTGQIASMMDNVLGETVSYGYDAMTRLMSAGGALPWSQSYSYDGFGNLTAKSGSGAVFSNAVDQTTDRVAGTNVCYDPDGNLVSDANGGGCGNPNHTYDIGNRLVSAKVSGGTETYAYDARNKRVGKRGANGSQTIYIYDAMGEKLAVSVSAYGPAGGNGMSILASTNNVYFAGRLIKESTDVDNAYNNNFAAVDR
jgi:YD repeat-containing protein